VGSFFITAVHIIFLRNIVFVRMHPTTSSSSVNAHNFALEHVRRHTWYEHDSFNFLSKYFVVYSCYVSRVRSPMESLEFFSD
jgi:hypothetical protein